MLLRLVVGCLVCAAAVAGEADPRAQARTLHQQAESKGDWWTCLQIEDWARAQTPVVRPGTVFNGSEVIGRARWAFPCDVTEVIDRGDEVVVVGNQRVFRLAADGRPLALSVDTPLNTWSHATGFGARALLQFRVDSKERNGPPFLQPVTIDLISGKPVLPLAAVELVPGNAFTNDDRCTVAVDGSAALLTTTRQRHREALSTAWIFDRKGLRELPGLREPVAIGPEAAWAVANERGTLVLCRGDGLVERQPIRQAAIGPGIAAIFIQGKELALVDAKGERKPFDPGVPFGNNPEVRTIGDWLVVWTGPGATGAVDDLAGDASQKVELPPVIACFRWSELAAGKLAPAPQVVNPCGSLPEANHLPTAIYRWQGDRIEIIDLSGQTPQVRPFAACAGGVGWVQNSRWAVVANRHDGGRTVFNSAGKEIWRSAKPADDVEVVGFNNLVVRQSGDQGGWLLVHPDPDPAKRSEAPLPELVGRADIRCDPWRNLIVARQREAGLWRTYDGQTAAPTGKGGLEDGATPCPDTPWWTDPRGRFLFRGGRIYAKAEGWPEDPLARLELHDAWKIGSRLFLMARDDRLLTPGRKKGTLDEVGKVPAARQFGLVGKAVVLRADDGDDVLATVQPDPLKLLAAANGKVENVPEGPWKVDWRHQFTPLGQPRQQWAADRCASPVHLRSIDKSRLLVVMQSLCIDLDVADVRMVAAPVPKEK